MLILNVQPTRCPSLWKIYAKTSTTADDATATSNDVVIDHDALSLKEKAVQAHVILHHKLQTMSSSPSGGFKHLNESALLTANLPECFSEYE